MRIVTWNIGGGFVSSGKGFIKEDLNYFITVLKILNPDIICFQEIHLGLEDQTKIIAQSLKYPYYCVTPYDSSHLKENNQLCLSVISRFTLLRKRFFKLPNPQIEVKRPNGEIWKSHDKGFMIVSIKIRNENIDVITGHTVPFSKFNRDFMEPEFNPIRKEIERLILKHPKRVIVAGDMNYADLVKLIPKVFQEGFKEVFKAPTHHGKQMDHILISKEWAIKDSRVVLGKADHYMAYADIELM